MYRTICVWTNPCRIRKIFQIAIFWKPHIKCNLWIFPTNTLDTKHQLQATAKMNGLFAYFFHMCSQRKSISSASYQTDIKIRFSYFPLHPFQCVKPIFETLVVATQTLYSLYCP